MARLLHRWPGLLALALVTVLALSGAALSVFPAAERLAVPAAAPGPSVAELAARLRASRPGVEEIRRAPSGRITVYWFDGVAPGAAVVDPGTGATLAPADPDPLERWLRSLHRSLFLGDAGRLAAAAGAAALLALAVSGAALVARRAGGWRRWGAPVRGPRSAQLHVAVARVALPGLALSALTALWMSASTFGLVPDADAPPPFPEAVSGATGIDLAAIALLRETPVERLRSLSFPAAGDASDVYRLQTDRGTGYLDQGTGRTLAWADRSGWAAASELIYGLHTGTAAPLLGLLLGLAAVAVPALGLTGGALWWAGQRGRGALRGNRPAGQADTILLVGSEGGSTWGFAATLRDGLTQAGHAVHVAPMSAFDPVRYARAERIVVLAATYGAGAAPASAAGFLDRLAGLDRAPAAALAVLGFGDRGFPDYCAYARAVAAAAAARGWASFLPFDTVDRQSAQEFARWGRGLGAALGIDLNLVHRPDLPALTALTLVSRRAHGGAGQAPAAILRFALPSVPLRQRLSGAGLAQFEAGDLLAVVPEGEGVPRLYSLASSRRDGFVEIVVRAHPGGLCSGQLMALRPGDGIRAFLRRNPGFRPGRGRAPLILIGAGTGIAPLAGIIRGNAARRPIHLVYGMRHADSDFLYDAELRAWRADGRLAGLATAVSRGGPPCHVQDLLRRDAAWLARMVRGGARVMVCGGRDMAAGVAEALAEALAPAGPTPAALKAEGRYVEDVY